jgi:hypothetical protein
VGKETNKAKKGNYYSPMPLDFELLRRMPAEGTMLGFHVLALTAKHITTELNKTAPPGGALTSHNVTARLRSMHVAGYVTPVQVMGASTSGQGWQRTPKGEAFLKEQKPGLQLVEDLSPSERRAESEVHG